MKIAVLSRNPKLFSTQRLIEEIQNAGHEAMVVDHSVCDLIIEQEGPSIIYRGQRLEGVDAIIPRIGASVTFYGTAVVRQFELMGAFSAVTSQAIVRSRDKLRSLQILSKNGLGMPKTAFTNFSKGGEKQLIEQVSGAPVIIKLFGSPDRGIRRCLGPCIQTYYSWLTYYTCSTAVFKMIKKFWMYHVLPRSSWWNLIKVSDKCCRTRLKLNVPVHIKEQGCCLFDVPLHGI